MMAPMQETAWPAPRGELLVEVDHLRGALRAEQEYSLMLAEDMATMQLAVEDRGWLPILSGVMREFTADGRRRMVELCRVMAIANPLIKRGLLLRTAYIWGQGLEVTATVDKGGRETADNVKKARDAVADEVNQLIDAFQADNEKTWTGIQSRIETEWALGTDGELFVALFTDPFTGRVQVRTSPPEEVVDIVHNPHDRNEPWFYIREYEVTVLERGYGSVTSSAGPAVTNTRTRTERRKVAHPALGFRPATKPRAVGGALVDWSAPMLHIAVNRPLHWTRGIPDAYAAIAWARAYKDFLTDWALLTKSLATFAWRVVGENRGTAAKAAERLQTAGEGIPAPPPIGSGVPHGVGQAATMAGASLEAIPKSGAHIDADSGRPLAAMAAAGLGQPVTFLLADPGVTGARATAETLDYPTILEAGMRRLHRQSAEASILRHVIESSIEAPQGRLDGRTTIDDWGMKRTEMADGVEPALDFNWPPLGDVDETKLIAAVVAAHSTGILPNLTTARLLLQLLGVKDVDEALLEITDERGEFVDKNRETGDELVDQERERRQQDREREPAR